MASLFTEIVKARIVAMKRELHREIMRDIEEGGHTVRGIAHVTGLSQSDISDLTRGHLRRFSVERLCAVLIKFGHDPRVYITQ